MQKKSERKVVKEAIVKRFGFEEPSPWYKIWFFYKPRWWWTDFSYWFRSKKERFLTGFPHAEAWNFKDYHAQWCLPRLKYLRDNHIGCPSTLRTVTAAQIPSHLIGTTKNSKKKQKQEFSKKLQTWKQILDKMIWSFEHFDDHIRPIYPKNYDKRMRKVFYDDGTVSYTTLDDRNLDYSPQGKHNKKVQEGLDLFAKYYHNMWD